MRAGQWRSSNPVICRPVQIVSASGSGAGAYRPAEERLRRECGRMQSLYEVLKVQKVKSTRIDYL